MLPAGSHLKVDRRFAMTPETHTPFSGFDDENRLLIRLPEAFFTQLLPKLDSLTSLRLILYLFWHNEQQERPIRYFTSSELASDNTLLDIVDGEAGLSEALTDLVNQGVLLQAKPRTEDQPYYFINTSQGRAATEAIREDKWQSARAQQPPIIMPEAQPNIFKLYEENIGAITPMMAEILKDDEQTYPNSWIKDAIEIAVARNARNWKYVQAILTRWQKEGRGDEQNRRNDSQDPDSYRQSWLGRKQ